MLRRVKRNGSVQWVQQRIKDEVYREMQDEEYEEMKDEEYDEIKDEEHEEMNDDQLGSDDWNRLKKRNDALKIANFHVTKK